MTLQEFQRQAEELDAQLAKMHPYKRARIWQRVDRELRARRIASGICAATWRVQTDQAAQVAESRKRARMGVVNDERERRTCQTSKQHLGLRASPVGFSRAARFYRGEQNDD